MSDDEVDVSRIELGDADLSDVTGGRTTVRDSHDRYSNTDKTIGAEFR